MSRTAPAAPLVHGMNAALVAPDWPPLTLDELQQLAPHFAVLRGPLRLLWHSPRPFSAAARVRSGQGEVFVKRHDRRVRGVAALLEEHRFIEHLRERGLCVPPLHRDTQGSSARALAGSSYEVHAPVPGVDAYRDVASWVPVHGPAHARALGQALARLHLAARGYEALPRGPHPLLAGIDIIGEADLSAALTRFVARRPALRAYLQGQGGVAPILDALAPLHARLQPLIGGLERIWVHNDWHASNLFWSDRGPAAAVTAVIDFGLCNAGWAVADLATALERNTVAWLQSDGPGPVAERALGRSDLALALLGGYTAVRALSAAEREALPLLLSLAHVEYALSEAQYFSGVLGQEATARLAHPDFLLGHIAWFAGRQGQAYRRALAAVLA